jgi:urea transport system permease protein
MNIIIKTILVVLLLSSGSYSYAQADSEKPDFEALINQLTDSNYQQKEQILSEIYSLKDPRKLAIMEHMLEGQLYYVRDDKTLVFRQAKGDNYQLTNVLTLEKSGTVEASALKKIRVNNKLRGLLRSMIARLSLEDEDEDVRLKAVNNINKNINTSGVALLRDHLQSEKSKKVRKAMQTGIALVEIDSAEQATRISAIKTLGKSDLPVAKNRLIRLLEKDDSGEFIETDTVIRNKANVSLEKIDTRLGYYRLIETTFFGLSLGSVLLLIGVGLAITFGVMGVINMAHGELMMIGAYTTYVVQLLMPDYIDYSLFVAIPLAFLVAGLFGVVIERTVIRFLYGRPLETLLATFGISLILQQMVRSIFSPLNRSVITPEWMSGSWQVNAALSLTYNRLYVIVFSLIVFFFLLLLLKKTSLGLQVRAVSQNRPMAKAMGVRSEWVDALTFGLGSGIAGVAGVALSQLTNVGPNLGQAYIIDSFMVVVFGGVGNLWGTFVSAMSLGVFNKFIEPATGAVLAKILVLVLIILFIQKRPRGMFPQKGRAVES